MSLEPIIPVSVIDDQVFFGECFSNGLKSVENNFDMTLFASLAEWKSSRRENIGEVIILSIRLPKDNIDCVYETVRMLTGADRTLEIIILADIGYAADIRGLVECGARGWIPTNVRLGLAAQAIKLVHAGGTFLPIEMMSIDAGGHTTQGSNICDFLSRILTPRQFSVAELIHQGKSNKEIAIMLDLEESTVKVHVRAIMRKLKARNRTEVGFIINSRSRYEH